MRKILLLSAIAVTLVLATLILCRLQPQSPPPGPALPLPPPAVRTVPTILRSFPHDTAAFTQGLVYERGLFYESDGIYGRSALRIVDTLGREKRRIAVADVFAEGLARFAGRFVQLTWREGAALVYDSASLAPLGRFPYEGEGWGLTVAGGMFVMSNGSDSLYWRDAADFHVIRGVGVTLDGSPVSLLNELEAARGLIWANVWQSDLIVAIDPHSGQVKQVVDCRELVRVARASYRGSDVLNGIAWDPARDIFYLTGKNWPLVFAVKM